MYDEQDYISDERRKEFQDIFDQYDKDKDGKISGRELANVMFSMGLSPTDDEINAMIKEVDLNNDGKIDLDEFITLMTKTTPDTQTEDEVINAFRVFDKQGNGLIPSDELKHIMMTIGDKMTEEEATEMINEADIDEDGMINYEKFVSINSRNNSNADNEMGQELQNMNFSDKNNSSNNESVSKTNSINYDTSNTGYTKDKHELFSEKEHDESSTFN